MNYDELVKRLRRCEQFKCRECDYEEVNGCRGKLNAEAADAIEELQKPRWISVKERLPEAEDDVIIAVLTHFPNRKPIRTVTMDYINTAGEWDAASCDWRHEVTHWQPFPAPPKEDEA